MGVIQAPIPPIAQSAAILRASGLAKSFKMGDSRIDVLKSVDFQVARGEFVAIEGRSGSGKSTLLHVLGVLDVLDKGAVFYENVNISRLSESGRATLRNKHFGFVFQFYHLLPELNVLENTLLAPMIELSTWQFLTQRPALRHKAGEVLASLGMQDRLKHRPAQLSGGERQRVAIARALMNSPKVLFADEPTGNLDVETGQQIMGVLENLHRTQNQTIIMVTHDRTLARRADRILVLRDGALQPAEA